MKPMKAKEIQELIDYISNSGLAEDDLRSVTDQTAAGAAHAGTLWFGKANDDFSVYADPGRPY